MNKPRILVTAAAGNTGLPTALQLLEEGFPVTAMVRREDHRSEKLKALGARIVVGSMNDIVDMRKAMEDVERAYFCAPVADGYLRSAAIFTSVAKEVGLRHVVAMSQWLASPVHPSKQTRECWLSDQILSLIPGCELTILNPGYFAYNDMQMVALASQFGLLMLPYGSGKNAAPSSEDIGRVAAAVLANPESHGGRNYRVTGPKMLDPKEIAQIFSKVLDRKVRYLNVPTNMLVRVVAQMGFGEYVASQMETYSQDYASGTFEVGGPTDVVRQITGREAEDYESIVRRSAATLPDVKPSLSTKLKFFMILSAAMLRRRPDMNRYLASEDFSSSHHMMLSGKSRDWIAIHEHQDNSVPSHHKVSNETKRNSGLVQSTK